MRVSTLFGLLVLPVTMQLGCAVQSEDVGRDDNPSNDDAFDVAGENAAGVNAIVGTWTLPPKSVAISFREVSFLRPSSPSKRAVYHHYDDSANPNQPGLTANYRVRNNVVTVFVPPASKTARETILATYDFVVDGDHLSLSDHKTTPTSTSGVNRKTLWMYFTRNKTSGYCTAPEQCTLQNLPSKPHGWECDDQCHPRIDTYPISCSTVADCSNEGFTPGVRCDGVVAGARTCHM